MEEERYLDILLCTADEVFYKGRAKAVTIPGVDGELGILPRHSTLTGLLGCGEVKISTGSVVERFFVAGGFFFVHKDEVSILPEEVFRPEELSQEQVLKELEAAIHLPMQTEAEQEIAMRRQALARSKLRLAQIVAKPPSEG